MEAIWKYEIIPSKGYLCEIEMPKGATVLSAGSPDREHIYVWAEVDTDEKKKEIRQFFVYPTGSALVDPVQYGMVGSKKGQRVWMKRFLATVFIDNTPVGLMYVKAENLVFHVYVVDK